MSQVISPYTNTELTASVVIPPEELNNEFYINVKKNLINNLENKCYKDRGFISKIYKVNEISDALVIPEDPTCSAKVNVRFSCTVCEPVRNKELICKVDRKNKALMSAVNGPIKVIITYDKISEKFFLDEERDIRYKVNKTTRIIEPNDYIRVFVLSYAYNSYDTEIIAIAKLIDMASDNEIELYKKNLYSNN